MVLKKREQLQKEKTETYEHFKFRKDVLEKRIKSLEKMEATSIMKRSAEHQKGQLIIVTDKLMERLNSKISVLNDVIVECTKKERE